MSLPKAVMSWSSGKDSAFALYEARRSGEVDVVALLTTVTSAFGRVSMHGVREALLDRQTEALGLPCRKVLIPSPCPNEVYEREMARALGELRGLGVDRVVFGDIFLEDLRRYRETKLGEIGMTAVFPLWMRDTRSLARDMIASGLRAAIACIDPRKVDRSFAGRPFDASFLAALPEEVDPCGENGEFHTFASAGPMWKGEISTCAARSWNATASSSPTCSPPRSGESRADSTRDRGGLLFGRVGVPRPEEPPEPVLAPARNDVHVHVRDALAHLVVERDERALGAERRLDRGRHPLGRREEVTHLFGRHFAQRPPVGPGYDEHVPGKDRAHVEERDDAWLVKDDVGVPAPRDDLAEGTQRRHGGPPKVSRRYGPICPTRSGRLAGALALGGNAGLRLARSLDGGPSGAGGGKVTTQVLPRIRKVRFERSMSATPSNGPHARAKREFGLKTQDDSARSSEARVRTPHPNIHWEEGRASTAPIHKSAKFLARPPGIVDGRTRGWGPFRPTPTRVDHALTPGVLPSSSR